MTDHYADCRWFLRDNRNEPYREVGRIEWLMAERAAGFRGGDLGRGQPATAAWIAEDGPAGVLTYANESPPEGAIEWSRTFGVEVTYEWGWQLRVDEHSKWGAVRESYEDNEMDAEDRARSVVERHNRGGGAPTARLVRRRVERHGWERG